MTGGREYLLLLVLDWSRRRLSEGEVNVSWKAASLIRCALRGVRRQRAERESLTLLNDIYHYFTFCSS